MDSSQLPSAQYIPGRQEIIDHAALIDKKDFKISIGFLFGIAILGVLIRLVTRLSGRRQIRWDDGLVTVATATLVATFCSCLRLIDPFYIVEAMNKGLLVPFREEIPILQGAGKWSAVFGAVNHTTIYMVKLSFLTFFHTLIRAQSRHIWRYYWFVVGTVIVCWLFSAVCPFIVCPYFGADRDKCTEDPNQHSKSLLVAILNACVDIVTDAFIISIPILVLRRTRLPLVRKISLASFCCLSVAIIICAFIRLGGVIADTKQDSNGSAPVWDIYWCIAEACIAVVMTSVTVIRSAFIAQQIREDKRHQDSVLRNFGRRLLSTLRLPGSSASSRRSPPRVSDNHYEVPDVPSVPKIGSQHLTRGTLNGVRTFIGIGNREGDNEAGVLKSVDTTIVLEDLDYHRVWKNEMPSPSTAADSKSLVTSPSQLSGT